MHLAHRTRLFKALFIVCFISSASFGVSPSEPTDVAPWADLAINDLKAIHSAIENIHPAPADAENDHASFMQWLEKGLATSSAMAREKPSFEGYRFALRRYLSGFQDSHLRVLSLQRPKVLWPGFLLTFDRGTFYISAPYDNSDTLPPNRAQVVSINHRSPKDLMRTNMFPFTPSSQKLESSWTKTAPFLLLDEGNPWAEKISSITCNVEGISRVYNLSWNSISRSELGPLIQKATYGPRPLRQIKSFGKNGIWISIPSFVSTKPNQAFLKELIQKLPLYRDKHPIVFDMRGNSGGNSTWTVKILRALYTDAYLASLNHIKNSDVEVRDRISDFLIQQIDKQIDSTSDPREKLELIQERQNLIDAKRRGETFCHRDADVNVLHKLKNHQNGAISTKNPVKGPVYLLVDGRCFSSCLIFADSLLSIPNTVLIGGPTDADTQFSNPFMLPLPSGISTLLIPTMIRGNWARKDNEPYIPEYQFPGYMGDDQELEKWVLKLNSKLNFKDKS